MKSIADGRITGKTIALAVVGLAFLGLALRHCVVLWREPREPSSALVVVALA